MLSKSQEYKLRKKEYVHSTGRERVQGKVKMYYYPRGNQIIVIKDDKEYLFKALKDAKSKLRINLQKDKNYFTYDGDDSDFTFDVETGLYWRYRKDDK